MIVRTRPKLKKHRLVLRTIDRSSFSLVEHGDTWSCYLYLEQLGVNVCVDCLHDTHTCMMVQECWGGGFFTIPNTAKLTEI